MRFTPLAGIAALALAGSTALAVAGAPATHVLNVALPGGGVEQIRYTGDVPPTVVFEPASPLPIALMRPAFAPSFAALDRIAAEMDQQAAAMLQQAESLANAPLAGPDQVFSASLGSLPPGVSGQETVVTMTGNGVCTRTVNFTSRGDGARPQVVSNTSGSCGTPAQRSLPAQEPFYALPQHGPGLIEAKAAVRTGVPAYRGLLHDGVAWSPPKPAQ